MSLDLHLVSSDEAELSPQDIFAVAAHVSKEGPKGLDGAAKRAGITPERMRYSLFVKEYSDPKLIRIRAGNTLFTIVALPKRVALVRAYNADTALKFVDNMESFFYSARDMGFDHLIVPVTKEGKVLVRRLSKRLHGEGIQISLNKKKDAFLFKTGPARGE